MHRPTIGVIAFVLLATGLYTYRPSDIALSSACLRVGTVMSILWFAHPQLKHVPGWLIAVTSAALLIATRWPKALLLALPVAGILWILSPRRKRVKDEGS